MSMVKIIITDIEKPVNHIYNVSFQTGVFSNQMKIATVFKAGDNKCVLTNYRPISLQSQLSKILEKLYNAKLYNCLIGMIYCVWVYT